MKQFFSVRRASLLLKGFLPAAGLVAALFAQPVLAASCPNTPWQASNGRTCANLGLNSRGGTCENGYITRCDDTRDSIRVCRTNKSCQSNARGGWGNQGWAPAAGSDYINYRGRQFHCTEWNFRKSQPCPAGTLNPDCKGDCR